MQETKMLHPDPEVHANRAAWLAWMREPGRRLGKGRLELLSPGGGEPYRCCLGQSYAALRPDMRLTRSGEHAAWSPATDGAGRLVKEQVAYADPAHGTGVADNCLGPVMRELLDLCPLGELRKSVDVFGTEAVSDPTGAGLESLAHANDRWAEDTAQMADFIEEQMLNDNLEPYRPARCTEED